MFHSRMGYRAREIFSLVWLSIELIFYIEILLYIAADIQSKKPFGAIAAPQPIQYIIIVSWWQHH
jgi:hypothetical protein